MKSNRMVKFFTKCPRAEGIQHIGMRSGQQDVFYISDAACWIRKGLLAVLADGMGGIQHGELASMRAVEILKSCFESLSTISIKDVPHLLLKWTNGVNESIHSEYVVGQGIDCGTTLLSVWIMGTKMHFLSVGDSRIYLGRCGEWFALNEDHTYRNLLYTDVIMGTGTEIATRKNTASYALSSYIGDKDIKRIDYSKRALEMEAGDVLLLSSDGFYGALGSGDIWKKITDPNISLTTLMQSILDLRLTHQDNATAIRIML